MDASSWAIYASLAGLILAGAVIHYRRREPAGRGRTLLGLLRGGALAVLLLLLFDPRIPTRRAAWPGGTVALVDRSASMALPVADGGTRWDRALEQVRDGGFERVLTFGAAGVERPVSLDSVAPEAEGSRLGPAIRAAVEAGAARVVVFTDGAVEDAREALEVGRRSGVPVEIEAIGGATLLNIGVTDLRAPAWLEPGAEATVQATVAAVGTGPPGERATATDPEGGSAAPDSVGVELRLEGRRVAAARVPVPREGRSETATLRFTPPAVAADFGRLEVAVDRGGSMTGDDRRVAYVRIAEEPAGVALVSFRPDQEPRFLLPVLERAIGLPAVGWLALPGDRFIRVGRGPGAGAAAAPGAVREAVRNADLVVLHGLTPAAPAWALDAAASAERLIVLPGPEPVTVEPLALPPPVRGEWYLEPELPPSPVAPFLAGLETAALPPLPDLRPVDPPAGFWEPLRARLVRSGSAAPAVLAGSVDARRIVVGLASGYWRWAFADEEGRDVYDRLWAGLGAWVMEDDAAASVARVRPAASVVAREEPIQWLAPAGSDSVRIRLERVEGEREGVAPEPLPSAVDAALDTVLALNGGRAAQEAVAPGEYRWTARAGEATGEGRLTVEPYSAEWTRPIVALASGNSAGPGGPGPGAVGSATGGVGAGAGEPLHATPWPYAVVLLLLCVEWVLRRRWGLR